MLDVTPPVIAGFEGMRAVIEAHVIANFPISRDGWAAIAPVPDSEYAGDRSSGNTIDIGGTGRKISNSKGPSEARAGALQAGIVWPPEPTDAKFIDYPS